MTRAGRAPRIASLDGVRGLAVFAVLLFHAGVLPGGWIGVDVFFGLSGFLITGILLDARATGATAGAILRPFFARRALRILPLAFVVAAITGWATHAGWNTLWYVSYVQNWMPEPPAPRALAHYWSLAVEEQFYLLWPAAVLLLSSRQLARVSLGLLVIGAAARWALTHFAPPFATPLFLGDATLLRADPIAAGALVAILVRANARALSTGRCAFVLCASLGAVALTSWWGIAGTHTARAYVFQETALAMAIGAALALIVQHPPRWLATRWLAWSGTVSYGTYVIHGALTPWFRAHISMPAMCAAALLAASASLAALSWYQFESRVMRLKSRWPMPSDNEPAAALTLASPAAVDAHSETRTRLQSAPS